MNAETPLAESDLADAVKWRKRRRIRGVLMLLAPLVVIVGSIWFYLTGGRYESTENAQLQTGMTTLTNGLPNARIFVASIPDIKRLWEVGHGSAAALSIWNAAQICQSMLANPTSTAPADVARRDRVRQRAIDDNIAIAAVCSQYPNCKFDNHATFNYPFALSQLSTMDYFHPSAALQAVLAQVTYAAGYNW